MPMLLVAISGSLRRDSYNTALLRAAADILPPGAELTLYRELEEIPPFNEDRLSHPPVPVQSLRGAVAAADGVLISTPEYNSSIPGVLKNALDWLSRPLIESPLRNKPVAVIGASTGMSEPSGHKPRPARCSARSVPACSTASCRCPARTSNSAYTAASPTKTSSASSSQSCKPSRKRSPSAPRR